MIDDIIQLKVDKILLGINAHNVIKKLREPWVLWQLYCKREECFVMLNMESFPCKHDNMLLVDIKQISFIWGENGCLTC